LNDTPFAKRDTIEFVERGLVKAFTDAVRLRALGPGARVIDVLEREIELVLAPFGINSLPRSVSTRRSLTLCSSKKQQHTVIGQIGRRDGRLAVVELNASNTLQVAD